MPVVRPFAVLAVNVAIGSVGLAIGGFAGGCMIAALVVADCMAVIAEGRAWKREDAADTVYDWSTDERQADPGRGAGRSQEDASRSLRAGRVADPPLDRPAAQTVAQAVRLPEPVTAAPFDWGREGRAG